MSLSSIQKEQLARDGYLLIADALPATLIAAVRRCLETFVTENPGHPDVVMDELTGGYLQNIASVCNQGDLSALELLGSPEISGLAAALCGEDVFVMQDFCVVKTLGDTTPVNWHQDLLHRRTGPHYSIGVYLDDAMPGDGALRVVPGSHVSGKNICDLLRDPSEEIAVRSGSILVHDLMLAHCSGILTHNQLRRVIYFIIHPTEAILSEKIYPYAAVNIRSQLLPVAKMVYENRHTRGVNPGTNTEAVTPSATPEILSTLKGIYDFRLRPRPSAYCLGPF